MRWCRGNIGDKIFAPWLEQLTARGVELRFGERVVDFDAQGAVITAVDTFEEWIFQSQGADRLSIKEKERIHMRFNGIWPVADRDVVLDNTLTQKADGEILLHSENAEGFKDKQQGVETCFGTAPTCCTRIVNSHACQNEYELWSLDVGGAFLKGFTFDDINNMSSAGLIQEV